MSDHVTINRDPFARQELVHCGFLVRRSHLHWLVRRVDPDTGGSGRCDWCGGSRGGLCGSERLGLFEYGIEPDSIGGRVNWIEGRYCGVDCMRAHLAD